MADGTLLACINEIQIKTRMTYFLTLTKLGVGEHTERHFALWKAN
jgi:hypothetical protein